ncbi:hypothetical protein [Alkaliphilus flagellatus]|uniref:hypothetical protein n=1 Tax=Alkaliphilus flagellatus TaxID=2841507 RepID=UPI001FE751CE|nr:hypothetical protein [Alkaliphilus flagellatus]
MVTESSIITNLKLSDEEMKKINILDYPENFKPKNNAMQTPFYTYHIKIIVDGREKSIFWEDGNISQSKDSIQLRELFKKIQEIIVSKEEFKKLPKANGGYD